MSKPLAFRRAHIAFGVRQIVIAPQLLNWDPRDLAQFCVKLMRQRRIAQGEIIVDLRNYAAVELSFDFLLGT